MDALMRLLLDTNVLIDVLKGEATARDWLEEQQQPAVSVITWIEVLGGCRTAESQAVEAWLDCFERLPLDRDVARESVQARQRHGLKVPDAIILATAHCNGLTLATRNSKDFPLSLGDVLHPYSL